MCYVAEDGARPHLFITINPACNTAHTAQHVSIANNNVVLSVIKRCRFFAPSSCLMLKKFQVAVSTNTAVKTARAFQSGFCVTVGRIVRMELMRRIVSKRAVTTSSDAREVTLVSTRVSSATVTSIALTEAMNCR